MPDFDLFDLREAGLYCPAGGFYVDPSQPVERAVVTHAHADHTRPGHDEYICTVPSEPLVRRRSVDNPDQQIVRAVTYGESIQLGDVEISFHPAGHMLGSAQVRATNGNEVWVITGDFKRKPDPTCRDFQPIDCDVLVIDVTYGLPVYRWRDSGEIFENIEKWYQTNRSRCRPSVLFGYSLGKAQRLLAGLQGIVQEPVLVHGALIDYNDIYRDHGVDLVETRYATDLPKDRDYSKDLILAPPSALQSNWMSRFKNASTALASGWMRIRGIKRRRGYDQGFVLSDHCDWPALLRTVEDVSPELVYATYGDTDTFCRYLREEKEVDSKELETLGSNGHE